MTKQRKVTKIVIHVSDTFPDMNIGVDWIRDIHVRENGWLREGYHKIIARDGTIQDGRPDEMVGAHVRSHNHDSVGICIVGGKARGGRGSAHHPVNFTHQQWVSLQHIVKLYKMKYPDAEIVGHCDLDGSKTCPNFNVKAWAEGL